MLRCTNSASCLKQTHIFSPRKSTLTAYVGDYMFCRHRTLNSTNTLRSKQEFPRSGTVRFQLCSLERPKKLSERCESMFTLLLLSSPTSFSHYNTSSDEHCRPGTSCADELPSLFESHSCVNKTSNQNISISRLFQL